MQGQVVKSVWEAVPTDERSALLPPKNITGQDSAELAERLPSKYAIRWAVIGFCAAFWAAVIAIAAAVL